MKKIFGYIIAQICYGIGHLISIPMEWFDSSALYYFYNKFMGWSLFVNDWASLDIWEAKDKDKN